jgi:hypothetical protein
MKPGEYTAAAVTALEKLVEKMALTEQRSFARKLVKLLKKGTKFILPDTGRYFEESALKGLEGSLLRLPYDVVVLEYFHDKAIGGDTPAYHRIIVAVDSEDTIEVYSIYSSPEMPGGWSFSPAAYVITRNRNAAVKISRGLTEEITEALVTTLRSEHTSLSHFSDEEILAAYQTANPLLTDTAVYLMDMPARLSPAFELSAAELGKLFLEMHDEVHALFNFIDVLACSNVEPTPVKRSFSTKKKLPSYANRHYVLTIGGKGRDASQAKDVSGERAALREHCRRGHIRRLSSDKKVWVSACVVNAGVGGKITKDYTL